VVDLNDVQVFVAVVRAGSFAGAARRLGMPANSVSRRIAQLEAQLGLRLFQRSTRKLTLTAAGSLFAERSQPAIDDLGQAAQEVMDGTRAPRGLVRVAAPADFLQILSIRAVAQFLRRYPEVQLQFVLDDALTDLVAQGVDLAFRGGHLADSNMVARRLAAVRHVLVASKAYLRARGEPTRPHQLSGHECIAPSRQGSAPWELIGPQGRVSVAVSGRFAANSARAVLQACEAGLGIALLPQAVVAADLAARRLQHVLPAYHRDGGSLSILFPTRHRPPLAVSCFVDFALEAMQIDGFSP